jgi:glycerophosphoryl diester phosphodiesterase
MNLKKQTMLLWLTSAMALASSLLPFGAQADGANRDGGRKPLPLVIGHRGTSGYLPEHSLESYALAVELGADYIEPDLVATKDGHLIARHEPNIINTTDVLDHPEFAGRRRIAMVDGVPDDGFFASDFTLAEIRTIHAKQAFAERPQQFNGKFNIATFEEIIALAKRKTQETGRTIGIYPETKHPTYHQRIGLPLEKRLIDALDKAGWNHRGAPVFIQSFEQANLKQLRKMTPLPLIQLIDADDVNADGSLAFNAPFDRPYDWTASGDPALMARTFGYFVTDAGLKEVATYADGIGPWKRYIVTTLAAGLPGPGEASRILAAPNDVITRAHKAGLLVHTWTFRNEQRRLASDYAGNPVNEYLQFYKLGIDGVFSDFVDTAVTARVLFDLETNPDGSACLTGQYTSGRQRAACEGSH